MYLVSAGVTRGSRRRSCQHPLAGALLLAVASLPAAAQDYPSRPVRLVVPFSAGGPADILGRLFGERLYKMWGQPIVILNKDGAGTIIGADLVANATPDGYTLLLASSALAINSGVGRKLPYDPFRDFAPIALVFGQPLVIVLNPNVPANTVRELIDLAKAHPGKLSYGSSGIGSSTSLTAEMFKSAAGVDIRHVPYKGVAPAMIDLLGGQVDMIFSGTTAAIPYLKSGRLKAIALTTRKRSSQLPDVPTLAESGIPDYDVTGWWGFMAPAGTPKAIVTRVNADLMKIVAMPEVRERLALQGGEAMTSTPEQFASFFRQEVERWARVAKGANIRIQ
jgi:tripartite-type tricarboxylate transporter receptor subunit TctC